VDKLRSRIVGEGEEAPDQLLANPMNWRRHPKEQLSALEGLLEHVGWVQRVIVNRNTGHMVDGHARVDLAMKRGEASVPVLYVELDPDEESAVLAALDPIGGLAQTDQDMLDTLLGDVGNTGNTKLDEFLATLIRQQADEGTDEEAAKGDLRADFLVPPFSVLDARAGYWQDRKRSWLAVGIDSGEGRRDDLLGKGLGDLAKRSAEQSGGITTLTGTSVFDPVLCEIAYRWFAPRQAKILDPFAGGSVRGVVAAMLGHAYTGVDLRPEQVAANERQWGRKDGRTIDGQTATAPRWIAADSRTLPELDIDDDVDLVFSCPPYADLEVYSDDPNDLSNLDYHAFAEAYSQIIAKACAKLKANRFAVFVVGEVRDKKGAYYDFVGDTIKAFRAAGLDYYNEAVIVTAVGTLAMRAANYMTASRKIGKTHQNVLVFAKGQPEKADIDALAKACAREFTEHRQCIAQHAKVLVFSKGDPGKAAKEFGPPPMDSDAALIGAISGDGDGFADPAAAYGEVL
jgi:hypothetical protein